MTEDKTKEEINRAVLVGLSAHCLTAEENATKHTLEELDTACRKKHEARGGFAERVFLVSKST